MKIIDEEYFKKRLIEDCRRAKRTGQYNMLKKYFRPEHQQAFKRNKVIFVRCPDVDHLIRSHLTGITLNKILSDLVLSAFDWKSYPNEDWNCVRYKYLGWGFDWTYLVDMREDENYIKYLI